MLTAQENCHQGFITLVWISVWPKKKKKCFTETSCLMYSWWCMKSPSLAASTIGSVVSKQKKAEQEKLSLRTYIFNLTLKTATKFCLTICPMCHRLMIYKNIYAVCLQNYKGKAVKKIHAGSINMKIIQTLSLTLKRVTLSFYTTLHLAYKLLLQRVLQFPQ